MILCIFFSGLGNIPILLLESMTKKMSDKYLCVMFCINTHVMYACCVVNLLGYTFIFHSRTAL